MHCPLVLPQIEDTFEDFLTNVTSLWLLPAVLHSHVSAQIAFPHGLATVGTGGHVVAYGKLVRLYSGKLCGLHEDAPSS